MQCAILTLYLLHISSTELFFPLLLGCAIVCCTVRGGCIVDVVRGCARVPLCMSFSLTFSEDEDGMIYLPRMSHSAPNLMMNGAEKCLKTKIKRIDKE